MKQYKTHVPVYREVNGKRYIMGMLCKGPGYAEQNYTEKPEEVTCTRCLNKLDKKRSA